MFKLLVVLATLSLAVSLPSVLGAPNPVPAPVANDLSSGFNKRSSGFGNVLNARHEKGHRRSRTRKRQSRTCHAPTSSSVPSEGEATSSSAAGEGETQTIVGSSPASTPAPDPTTSSEDSAPAPTTDSPPAETTQATNNNPDVQTYLDKHNNERAQHGANALTWADDLASVAQGWANNCVWKHSGGQYGENLSTGSSLDPGGAVQLWLDEAPDYDPSNPQYSHWTQVVWKNTKEIGCAVATCSGEAMFGTSQYGDAKFYVCNYRPAGNVIGQFAQNVQK